MIGWFVTTKPVFGSLVIVGSGIGCPGGCTPSRNCESWWLIQMRFPVVNGELKDHQLPLAPRLTSDKNFGDAPSLTSKAKNKPAPPPPHQGQGRNTAPPPTPTAGPSNASGRK